MADEPIPPRKGDVLFQDGLPDWWNNASLYTGKNDTADHGYTEGYRRGARILVERLIEQQQEQDYLVYPVIFLYRHHLELALKTSFCESPT